MGAILNRLSKALTCLFFFHAQGSQYTAGPIDASLSPKFAGTAEEAPGRLSRMLNARSLRFETVKRSLGRFRMT